MADAAKAAPTPSRWRAKLSARGLLRAAHRDLGHLAVGLTFVYAVSGIAVNHILEWDPNFKNYAVTHELGGPLAGDDDVIAKQALAQLAISDAPRDAYRAGPNELDVFLDHRTLRIDTRTGHVEDEGQKPRLLLRVANWLHVSRGKRAWTFVADAYAAGLLLLALSGLFMLPLRKSLLGRGGLLLLVGVAAPVVYIELAGGPDRAKPLPQPTAQVDR
jgi:hypothetical protein